MKIGPQYVTRRGAKAVVVLSAKDYDDLVSNKPSFKEFLLNCPLSIPGMMRKMTELGFSAAEIARQVGVNTSRVSTKAIEKAGQSDRYKYHK